MEGVRKLRGERGYWRGSGRGVTMCLRLKAEHSLRGGKMSQVPRGVTSIELGNVRNCQVGRYR